MTSSEPQTHDQTSQPDSMMLRDDPCEHLEEDLLERERLARNLATVLDDSITSATSVVAAVVGAWGSGKSTLLCFAEEVLGDQWRIAHFNPWLYSDLESMLLGFFAEIREVIPKKRRTKQIRKTLGKYTSAVAPLGKVVSLVGVDASGSIAKAGELLTGDQSATAAQKAFTTELLRLGQPILVVIDDLDRLMPDELLVVFKLIRQIARIPGIHYLLSYDEQTLRDLLAETPLATKSPARAGEYLEKIVQVRIDLPPLRESQQQRLIDAGLRTVLLAHELHLLPHDQERLGDIVDHALLELLSTPRAITRFCIQLNAFLGAVAHEVDLLDFLLITLLRTLEPTLYRSLPRWRADLLRRHSPPGGKHDLDAEQGTAKWTERLATAEVSKDRYDAMLWVLAELFPGFHGEINATYQRSEPSWRSKMEARMAIGDEDYFDRYFAYGVHADDWSDVQLAADLADLADIDHGQHADRIAHYLTTDAFSAARKIRARIAAADATGVPRGFQTLRLAC